MYDKTNVDYDRGGHMSGFETPGSQNIQFCGLGKKQNSQNI